ncbi:hypothetical protein PSN45_000088 [Yamadazyma tenuis]|uniref:Uncharacterized protein n=1 Tax=Candida tenuis (strain ATCC 10573 / BCRC 21748 / CBS 615 / JCM 9827 / NBRC 10315 / NRRL Y-1498 / VKM Y-70) TaxID=590646 RepID=G3BAJ2_CANTC|nr:uncharacterized protein CANTEDRAFT_124070 [Yamadazyma tenuis ATCC 10573]EGV61416.1 hypothetical protein CANTEDRAFT_124070 [Yamadazyma tenuis ATCC 10573]WEJ92635.1 hypothetical protein PSN45_000088 [Yamadazyma tenuis]
MPPLNTKQQFFQSLKSQTVKDSQLAGSGGYTSEIIFVSVNATSTTVVNSRTDKSLRVWKLTNSGLTESKIIESPHEKSVERIAWHPKHDSTFASVGRDSYVKVWRAHHGKLQQEIKIEKWHSSETPSPVSCQFVSYSPDGRILAVVDRDSTISFLAVGDDYRKVHELHLSQHIYDFQWFNHQHQFFVVALHDGTAPVYEFDDTTTSTKLWTTITGHRSSITSISIDPLGTYFALGSNEGVVSIHRCSTMLVEKTLTDVDDAISCVSISREGSHIGVAFDTTENIRIFEYTSGSQLMEVPNSAAGKSVLPSMCWIPNRTSYIFASSGCTTMTYMYKND